MGGGMGGIGGGMGGGMGGDFSAMGGIFRPSALHHSNSGRVPCTTQIQIQAECPAPLDAAAPLSSSTGIG